MPSAAFVEWLVTHERLAGDRARRATTSRVPVESRHVCLLFRRMRSWRERRDASVRARARGAQPAPRAGRRQLVPRARGGRGAAQRAAGDRAARGRAGAVRHAARPVLRARRRRAARLARPLSLAASRSVRCPTSRRRRCGRSPRRSPCCATCTGSEIDGRSPIRSPASSPPCARMPASRSGRRASRRWRTSAACWTWRGAPSARAITSFRALRRAARGRRRARRGGRGADRRGRHGRRAHHDRPSREGSRVPGRGARRPDGQPGARRGRPPRRSRPAAVRAAARRVGAAGAGRARSRGARARPRGGRRARSTSRRRARAICSSYRSLGDAQDRRLARAARSRRIYPPPAEAQAPVSIRPPGCPELRGDCVSGMPDRPRGARPRRCFPACTGRSWAQHEVVWWAPAALRLRVDEDVGPQAEEAARRRRARRALRGRRAWRTPPGRRSASACARPAPRRSLRVVTATERAASVARRRRRCRGGGRAAARARVRTACASARWCTACSPPSTSPPTATRWPRRPHCRGACSGRPRRRSTAATDAVVHALAHPLLRRAAARGGVPPRDRGGDPCSTTASIVEGVVDAAFADDGRLDGDRLQDRRRARCASRGVRPAGRALRGRDRPGHRPPGSRRAASRVTPLP